jgi:hypothetical protein
MRVALPAPPSYAAPVIDAMNSRDRKQQFSIFTPGSQFPQNPGVVILMLCDEWIFYFDEIEVLVEFVEESFHSVMNDDRRQQ